jgi:hypothetical protein
VWELLSELHRGILAVPNSLRIEVTAAAIISLLVQSPGPVLANNMYISRLGRFHAKPSRTGGDSGWHQGLHDLRTRITAGEEALSEG